MVSSIFYSLNDRGQAGVYFLFIFVSFCAFFLDIAHHLKNLVEGCVLVTCMCYFEALNNFFHPHRFKAMPSITPIISQFLP